MGLMIAWKEWRSFFPQIDNFPPKSSISKPTLPNQQTDTAEGRRATDNGERQLSSLTNSQSLTAKASRTQ
ncbi:uncharacterized protein G2W53_033400 [Senna tora]|uniref:Uncharacterized protein n=1 Tax=Senna tora TaxID=362788 RepID=A0A834SYE5_9FABA|nr:uncharacterized protein G2W53_033400 [Senna tora]